MVLEGVGEHFGCKFRGDEVDQENAAALTTEAPWHSRPQGRKPVFSNQRPRRLQRIPELASLQVALYAVATWVCCEYNACGYWKCEAS